MPKKRGQNEGTVYQRPDGRWAIQLSVTGKRLTRYAKSYDEALIELGELRALRQAAPAQVEPTCDVLTLADWVERWLAMNAPDLRPSTVAIYRKTIGYVLRVVGELPLEDLTALKLTETFAQLRQQTNAARQINLAHGYLRACLEAAVDLGVLETNPMRKVKKPKWKPRKRQYWSIEQTRRFIEVGLSESDYWNPLLVVLVTTGMRISEALGLIWGDIELDVPRLHVQRALVWTAGTYTIQPPKTEAGDRWISLPQAAVRALHSLSPGARSSPVFRNRAGSPPAAHHLGPALRALCDRAGVPCINVHGLRHVHAMLAKEAGADIYLVQQRLGHSNVRVTLEIYGYTPHDESGVGAALNDLLKS